MSDRVFIHLRPGLAVWVYGCPGVITAVSSTAWGCIIKIKVNDSEGDYHPLDFLENGIITLEAPQEAQDGISH